MNNVASVCSSEEASTGALSSFTDDNGIKRIVYFMSAGHMLRRWHCNLSGEQRDCAGDLVVLFTASNSAVILTFEAN